MVRHSRWLWDLALTQEALSPTHWRIGRHRIGAGLFWVGRIKRTNDSRPNRMMLAPWSGMTAADAFGVASRLKRRLDAANRRPKTCRLRVCDDRSHSGADLIRPSAHRQSHRCSTVS